MTDWDQMANSASGDAGVVAAWHQICQQGKTEEARWIAWLRDYGVKAAHPDDGHVDRSGKFHVVRFCYPQFDDGISVGDFVCLGWPDRFRVVKVRRIIPKGFLRDVGYEVC